MSPALFPFVLFSFVHVSVRFLLCLGQTLKPSEWARLIPSLQTTLCFVLQILLQLSRAVVDTHYGSDSVIFLSWR